MPAVSAQLVASAEGGVRGSPVQGIFVWGLGAEAARAKLADPAAAAGASNVAVGGATVGRGATNSGTGGTTAAAGTTAGIQPYRDGMTVTPSWIQQLMAREITPVVLREAIRATNPM